MTVGELIVLLRCQDPTDIVEIEDVYGYYPIDDDWSRAHYDQEDGHHAFRLHVYERPDNRQLYRNNDPDVI